ncbi:MAG: dihydrofolate reductase [Bacteroidales bacterium]
MKLFNQLILAGVLIMALGCGGNQQSKKETDMSLQENIDTMHYLVEQFADIRIMRYQVPGFDELSLRQKKLLYYLSEAALAGRDIIFDQHYKNNLIIRKNLEAIYQNFDGDRQSDDFKAFEVYLKRVWFSNGIHHHYSTDKFFPDCEPEYFETLLASIPEDQLPVPEGMKPSEFRQKLISWIFDPEIAAKRVSQDPDKDLIKSSAINFYEGVSEKEAVEFYEKMKDPDDPQPVSIGLNSTLVKKDGKLIEEVWYLGGKYSAAISKIVEWLEKAVEVADTPKQAEVIRNLIEYYRTGDLRQFDRYNILWVEDLESRVDFVNGFIETYDDPLGLKATWESVVNFRDEEATKRTEILSANAQWFEDHSPIDPQYKKEKVKGVSAKVITVVQLGGDCYPSTPIGINLPNADWIRKEHGSKSVTMDNITYAYDQAARESGFLEEFAWSQEEIDRSRKYGHLAGNLHTDLHECLGHGSGKLAPGTSPEALKNYASPLEEARADLFALYYLMDSKLIELGILPSPEVARTEYDAYIRNGLMTQLTRIEPGKNIEQAHMRNRQLIASWCFEKGSEDGVIARKTRDGKTFFVVQDYEKLRELFGALLREIQRIKSEGDYEAGKELVESYGVKVDRELHKEVLERYRKLNLAPYGGFINPVLKPVYQGDTIADIKIDYTEGYAEQMLRYSKDYSFLTQAD